MTTKEKLIIEGLQKLGLQYGFSIQYTYDNYFPRAIGTIFLIKNGQIIECMNMQACAYFFRGYAECMNNVNKEFGLHKN